MRSKVISFRVPNDLYEEFEQKCRDEEVSPTIKLREFVDNMCYPTKVDTSDDAKVTVTKPEKQSWFPIDFGPLFRKD